MQTQLCANRESTPQAHPCMSGACNPHYCNNSIQCTKNSATCNRSCIQSLNEEPERQLSQGLLCIYMLLSDNQNGCVKQNSWLFNWQVWGPQNLKLYAEVLPAEHWHHSNHWPLQPFLHWPCMRVYHNKVCIFNSHNSNELLSMPLAVIHTSSVAQLLYTRYHTRAFNGDCLKVMDTRRGAKSASLLMPWVYIYLASFVMICITSFA